MDRQPDDLQQTIDRWLRAVNLRGESQAVEKATVPTIQVDRCGWGENNGKVVQVIKGWKDLSAWLRLSPDGTVFNLDSEVCSSSDQEPFEAVVRYRLEVSDFVGGGEWRFQMAEDGRLVRIEHRPDNLDG